MSGALPIDDYSDPDLMTVHDFANKYRVDVSVVRYWVKMGYINWVLQGPRKMVRKSQLVKPIEVKLPVITPEVVNDITEQVGSTVDLMQSEMPVRLISYLTTVDGMDVATAEQVVHSMSLEDIQSTLTSYVNADKPVAPVQEKVNGQAAGAGDRKRSAKKVSAGGSKVKAR